MAAVRAAKRALRRDIKARLASLSEEEKVRQSHEVSLKLFEHPRYRSSRRLALFLSMSDEVRTHAVLRHALAAGKACFIPRYQGDDMDMLRLRDEDDARSLPVTAWNVRQPTAADTQREEALASGGLDLILMPGLGFDRNGNRLGRGKGFYDAYLKRCSNHPEGKPYTLALAFSQQLCDRVPVDGGDVLVDEVLYVEN